MSRIFVYGTLKRGFSAHDLMGNSAFVGEFRTHPRYHLYDVGSFPTIAETNEHGNGVLGEVYEVDNKAVMQRLDYYEGVARGLFRKELIDLSDGSQATAYMYNHQSSGSSRKIESGEWI